MDKISLLQEVFGLNSFRDKQEETIDSLLKGENTLCLMPTGMGKSLIYQYTALAQNKLAIVFSPLLALMGQQNETLNTKLESVKKSSFAFNSNVNSKNQYKYLKDSFKPPHNPQFLFLSPEKVMTDGFLEYTLKKNKNNIGLIVIDEAHCVSQWGHNFRPAYKMIPHLLYSIFGEDIPVVLCLTATLSAKDKDEIIKEFNIEKVIQSDSLYRHNIELNICNELKNNHEKRDELEKLLKRFENEKVIVYTHIKRREYGTREMSDYFKNKGFICAPFDSELDDNVKIDTLERFTKGEIKIVFATSAFGMGIDIPDIRCIIHYLIPESLEQYYQEVGRAGRNGEKSFAFLLHAEPNLRIKKDLIKTGIWNKESIKENWLSLLGREGENGIPYNGQLSNTDYNEDNSSLVLFLNLILKDIICILAKGLHSINCFEENGVLSDFTKYKNATNKGMPKLIFSKIQEDINTIHSKVFELYAKGHIKITSSPQKTIHYQVNKPIGNVLDSLKAEFDKIIEYKLENLSYLEMVLSGEININDALSKFLGIKN